MTARVDMLTGMNHLLPRLLLPLFCGSLVAQDTLPPYPRAEIDNGLIRAKVYLPDPAGGYYRATRFDWSGVVYSLTYGGHQFFGEWQQSNDPYRNDRIAGPVESFDAEGTAPGYDEASVGGKFLRIGIGFCEKPREAGYRSAKTYNVVDHGTWTVHRGDNWIEFVHELADSASGYAYSYTKRLTLVPGKPEMVLHHALRNTGGKAIRTNVFNHNFFVIDNQPTGPDFVVRFPFDVRATGQNLELIDIDGRELKYRRELQRGDYVMAYLTGFGSAAADNAFEIENRNVKAGVKVTADRPMYKLNYWSPRSTLCPEGYIDLRVNPGETTEWNILYEFRAGPAGAARM